MKDRMDKSTCSWWDGPCLFEVLDRIEVPLRDPKGPVRLDSYAYFILHVLYSNSVYSFGQSPVYISDKVSALLC